MSPVSLMLALVDEGFDHRAWHGPALLQSIRGLTAREAAWRPARGRHNVWEVVVHAAYWKHLARRRLSGEPLGRFPLRGANWFVRPAGSRTWDDDVRLLVEEHHRLRAVVAGLSPRALRTTVHADHSAAYTIRGIAAHDVYHAGQIQLIKALRKARAKAKSPR